MNYKPIIIVAGEPNSIFLEIFLKSREKNLKAYFNYLFSKLFLMQ